MKIEEIISQLGLVPLDQEGGYFRQTLSGKPEVDAAVFGTHYPPGPRAPVTAILALIGGDQFSAMHRLATDELWFFHMGDPLDMLMLHSDGHAERVVLGHELAAGQKLQHVVTAGTWQGSTSRGTADREGYSLVSCVMVPGFAWQDFELGDRQALQAGYPGGRGRNRETDEDHARPGPAVKPLRCEAPPYSGAFACLHRRAKSLRQLRQCGQRSNDGDD